MESFYKRTLIDDKQKVEMCEYVEANILFQRFTVFVTKMRPDHFSIKANFMILHAPSNFDKGLRPHNYRTYQTAR